MSATGTPSDTTARTSAVGFGVEARLDELDERARRLLFDRDTASDASVREAVVEIIADVKLRGDDALRALARRHDGVDLSSLEVGREHWDTAWAGLDPQVRDALGMAAAAIRRFHEAQLREPLDVETFPGVHLTRIAQPLTRVGVYAPGGTAAYPSSVLMGVVPARVAGVLEIVVCSPPGPNGMPSAAVMAACSLAGADRLFAIGGAGAVAALAHGTVSVPRVDRIVGPGNAYVAEAKRQLNGVVGIDSPAGPSELLIVADATAEPDIVALEMLAQAEHGPDAAVVLVTTHADLIRAVRDQLARRLPAAPRADIIARSFSRRGALLLAPDRDAALEFVALYAPEHLLLLVRDPRAAALKVRAAGTIFLGSSSSVSFGDYITGANHVLPTGRASASFSGLSTSDFQRRVTIQEVTPGAAQRLARPTASMAMAEGLPGHAAAALAHATRGMGSDGAIRIPPRLRAVYRQLEPYDPGRTPIDVDLSDNTNLFGECPVVTETMAALPLATRSRYPSVYGDPLKRAVARALGVEPENVVTGCGSDDVLDSAIRAFCEPGARIAYPMPTFGMVPAFARMNAVDPVGVPLGADLALDAGALLGVPATLTYICRPNNPTGHAFDRAAMCKVIEQASGIVLIDEAYAEFAADPMVEDAVASDRALVLRTFSKAYGLAGLRIGYAVGPAGLVREVEKSRGPYKVNAVAEQVALAMLERGQDWVRDQVGRVRANRSRLTSALEDRDFRVLPSEANFILVVIPHSAAGSARDLAARLRRQGVAVRPFPELPDLGDCIRVTVGPWPMMETFLHALDAAMSGGQEDGGAA